jgi:hypothetical protein
MVSRELEKECVVVFDEAHNIDNVCIEALSVNLRKQTLQGARNNIRKLHDVSDMEDCIGCPPFNGTCCVASCYLSIYCTSAAAPGAVLECLHAVAAAAVCCSFKESVWLHECSHKGFDGFTMTVWVFLGAHHCRPMLSVK